MERSKSRLPGIEGLRALAAISILIYHCWLYSSPTGQPVELGPLRIVAQQLPLGVTLFFALSGFLLYRPFAAAVMRGRPLPCLRGYLRSRALRILPAYLVILLVVGVVLNAAQLRLSSHALGIGSLAHDPALLIQSALLLQNYNPDTLLTGIGPAWSLSVEVAFYAILPALALIAARLARRASTRTGRRVAALTPAALLLLIGLSGKAAATFLIPGPVPAWGDDWHSVLDRSFWSKADLFTFGLVAAILRTDYEDGFLVPSRSWRWGIWVAVIAVTLLAGAANYAGDGNLHYYAYETLTGVACGLLLLVIVLPTNHGTKQRGLLSVLEAAPLVKIGAVSYSLFLWHEPLIRRLQQLHLTFPGVEGFPLNVGLVMTVSTALALVTYQMVERPALRLRVSRDATRSAHADTVVPGDSQAAP